MKVVSRVVTRKAVDAKWLNGEIGKRLRKERQRRGLTLQEVGNSLGVTRACVNHWELGSHANMLVTVVYNAALFYGVPVRRLLP